jgi:hypothetical protein
MILAIYFDEHLIEVPFVTGPGTPTAQIIRVSLAELEAPFTDRFVGEGDAARSYDLFDIAKAQGEAEVKPHCIANDLSGETMAAIHRRRHAHRQIMS